MLSSGRFLAYLINNKMFSSILVAGFAVLALPSLTSWWALAIASGIDLSLESVILFYDHYLLDLKYKMYNIYLIC